MLRNKAIWASRKFSEKCPCKTHEGYMPLHLGNEPKASASPPHNATAIHYHSSSMNQLCRSACNSQGPMPYYAERQ